MAFALLSRSQSKTQGSLKAAHKGKSIRGHHSDDLRFGFAKPVFQPRITALSKTRVPEAGVVQARLMMHEASDPYEQKAENAASEVAQPSQVGRILTATTLTSGQVIGRAQLLPCPRFNFGPRIPTAEKPVPTREEGFRVNQLSTTDLASPLASDRGLLIHNGPAASVIAEAFGARALAVGRHIIVGADEHRLETAQDRRLLAHEAIHVAQMTGSTMGRPVVGLAAAEREAEAVEALGPGEVLPSRVTARVLCKKARPRVTDPEVDRAATELSTEYPWLTKLSNVDQIVAAFASWIATHRKARRFAVAIAKLPSPEATYLSEERERRERRIAPLEAKRFAAAQRLTKMPKNIEINLVELLASDFFQGENALDTAGRKAVAEELRHHRCSIGVDYRGPVPAHLVKHWREYPLQVYLDGVWLPVQPDGIHLDAFWALSYATYAMLDVQKAYYSAVATQGTHQLQEMVDKSPWLAERELALLAEETHAITLHERVLSEEEELVAEYKKARLEYAETVRVKAQAALLPLALLASLLVPEGAIDLLLTVAPVHKVGKLIGLVKDYRTARKAKKGATQAEKLLGEIASHLDADDVALLKLASGLRKAELTAIKAIAEHVPHQSLLRDLMYRQLDGTADVTWIAKQLKKKKIDGDFVTNFTRNRANPSWKTLEAVVEGRKVAEETRASLASKVIGFLGEEAAARIVRSESFAKRLLKGRKGRKISGMWRGIGYGGPKSLDFVALSDEAEVVFGEVKNWGLATWLDARNRTEMLKQLASHTQGESEILKKLSRRKSDVAGRVLMVAEDGFKEWVRTEGPEKVKAFLDAVKHEGWSMEQMPAEAIEGFGELIERLR
jgi:hypothetical protein